jgi:hypothetical protein
LAPASSQRDEVIELSGDLVLGVGGLGDVPLERLVCDSDGRTEVL